MHLLGQQVVRGHAGGGEVDVGGLGDHLAVYLFRPRLAEVA